MQRLFGPILTVVVLFRRMGRVRASAGDMDPSFITCVDACDTSTCGSDPYGAPSRFGDGFPHWACHDDCVYDCMHDITLRRREAGYGPLKYYGHWPFVRLFGLEEPASVLFSLLNGVPYAWNLASSSCALSSPAHRHPSRQHYMEPWLVLYYVIGINAWGCSAFFHARKTPDSSLVDYVSALLFLAYSLWVACRRIWGARARPRAVATAFAVFLFLYGWQACRMARGLVPFHRHMQLCIGISVAIVATWSAWILLFPPTSPSSSSAGGAGSRYRYLGLLCQVWFSLAALLELFDFPALGGHFDAHSLWHLATVPLGFVWAVFWRLDTAADAATAAAATGDGDDATQKQK
jgi:hypothetical protein